MNRVARAVLVAMLAGGLSVSAAAPLLAQTAPPTTPPPVPVPKPFPGSAPPPATPPVKSPPVPATTPPVETAPAPAQTMPPAETAAPQPGAPSEATLGVKIFPGAEFLGSFDAGFGQRLFLFGTNATYAEVVAFYKDELRTGGRELFKAPAMQQFDLDRFIADKMAYPPSVVVKDYAWTGLSGALKDGYLFVDGTTEKRFGTIVQIVPGPVK